MKNNTPTYQRTTLQTIALIYIILHGLLFTFAARAFAIEGQSNSPLLLALMGLGSLASVVAAIGLWRWKRWGLYLYAAAVIVVAGVVLAWTASMIMLFGSLIPPIIVFYILQPVFKRLS